MNGLMIAIVITAAAWLGLVIWGIWDRRRFRIPRPAQRELRHPIDPIKRAEARAALCVGEDEPW